MFRKLNPAMWEWQTILTVGTFIFTLAVFLFFIVRAIRMKRPEAEHMSRLPVNDDDNANHTHEH
jgi:heme/copper-type cytochrome/quinol oxidase subunit 1